MVVTLRPSASETGVWQANVGAPSTCTVQAPHWAMPQPNLVPVRPATSRIAHSSGMSGSASAVHALPFRVSWMAIDDLAGQKGGRKRDVRTLAPGPGRGKAPTEQGQRLHR